MSAKMVQIQTRSKKEGEKKAMAKKATRQKDVSSTSIGDAVDRFLEGSSNKAPQMVPWADLVSAPTAGQAQTAKRHKGKKRNYAGGKPCPTGNKGRGR